MLRVTVELVPHGDDRRAEVIAKGWIANTGGRSGDSRADYYGEFVASERIGPGSKPPFYPNEQRVEVVRRLSVESFPRLERGVWALVHAALESAMSLPARLTQAEVGTAIGSATESSSCSPGDGRPVR